MDIRNALKAYINHTQNSYGIINKKEGIRIEVNDDIMDFYDSDTHKAEPVGPTIEAIISLDWEVDWVEMG